MISRNGLFRRRQTSRPNGGFTLIELLVVVAIIALLVSILVPALTEARRQAKVVVCLTNVKSYTTGLIMWAIQDSRGQYPPNYYGPWTDPRHVWSVDYAARMPTGFSDKFTYIDSFLEFVIGNAGAALWCPLDEIVRPDVDNQVGPYRGQLIHVTSVGRDNYFTGYLRFAGLERIKDIWGNPLGNPYDWSQSGNFSKTEAPMRPDHPGDVIVSDIIWSDTGYGDLHAGSYNDPNTHRDNNVGYSDGHAETHHNEITEWDPFPHWDRHVMRGIQYLLY